MYLYGASGHAKVIIEILEKLKIPIDGLFDDNPSILEIFQYKCGLFQEQKILNKDLIISIGNNRIRKRIAEKLGSINFGRAIDINSIISSRALIGEGSVIMPGAIINSSSKIGKHNIINTNVSIDHDCLLEDYVHVSPGSAIAGNVFIGEGTHIGTGVSIIPNVKIGRWCVIGAGSVIIKDIPDFVVVVGNPGKVIKYNSDKYNE